MTSTDSVQNADQVARPDPATSAQNQAIEETQTHKFTWKIDNFSSLGIKKIYSDSFEVGGYKWRVLLFPKGNGPDCLSMYLDVTDSATLPHGWMIDTQFKLALINQLRSESSMRRETLRKFDQNSGSDWGFTSFMPLMEFNDSSRGFLVNDTCIIEVELRLRQVLNNKINKLFMRDEKNGVLDDQGLVLRAEEIHEEERTIDPMDRLIRVCHFKKELELDVMKIQNFGEPFFLVVNEKETLAEIEVRIQRKLQVADEEFHEWKFAIVSMGQPEYLEDTDIIQNIFQGVNNCDKYLGLEHFDTVPKEAYSEIAHKIPQKARVSTTASQDQIGLKSPSEPSPPLPKACVTTPSNVPLSSSPQQHITTKDCVSRAIQILEPHMSEDFLIIDDDQTADVIAGQALKRSLESFSGMLQAMEKYKIQLDRQSKKLDNLQKANNSLSIAKINAEDALKAAEKKASADEAESAALKAKLIEFQAKELSWEAQKVKFEAELSSALKALETAEASTKAKEDELAEEKASRASEACSQKAKEKVLEEFGAEVGDLVSKYHQLLAISKVHC